MADQTWEITLNNQPHTVRLRHGTWMGIRQVWLDGQLLAKERQFFDFGSHHDFAIDGHSCELQIITNGLAFRYLLFVDGTPQLSKGEAAKRIEQDKLLQRGIAEHALWHDLARYTGLKLIDAPAARGRWQRRLVGKMNGYLVVVRYSQIPMTQPPVVELLVRFSPALDVNAFKGQLASDPELEQLLGKSRGDDHQFEENYTRVTWSYRPQRETAGDIAARVNRFVAVISKYARPTVTDMCEGASCSLRTGQPLQLVFVNDWPALFCAGCLGEAHQWGSLSKAAYRNASAHLVKGILAGLGVATLGGVVCATITILCERVAAIVGAAIFVSIVKVMDRVGTKRTVWSLLAAAGLAVLGIFLGAYLTVLWCVVPGACEAPTMGTLPHLLKAAWQTMWANTRFLYLSMSFGLVGIILYLILVWLEQRKDFSRMFRPKVEIVGEEWF